MDELKLGATYIKDGCVRITVLALEGDTALLQMEEKGEVYQYCVAYGIRYKNGELYWVVNGHYCECFNYDSPFQALCAAVEYMRGPKMVYMLLCDTTEGTFASVHHTYDDATAALNKSLPNNSDIKLIAEKLGLPCTAEAYLENKVDFDDNGAEDFYWIEETTF